MPDFHELKQSDIHRMLDAWADAHPEPFEEAPPAGPDEDTLRAYFAGRPHRDRRAPWWRRTEWRQVIAAAAVGVVLAVLFTALFVAAGA